MGSGAIMAGRPIPHGASGRSPQIHREWNPLALLGQRVLMTLAWSAKREDRAPVSCSLHVSPWKREPQGLARGSLRPAWLPDRPGALLLIPASYRVRAHPPNRAYAC